MPDKCLDDISIVALHTSAASGTLRGPRMTTTS
jgi:hypothetical protein